MRRVNKDSYPAEGLIALLEGTKIGRKVANRLFPDFMRRRGLEDNLYASYGPAFRSIFGDTPIDHPFLAMKRRRYLGEADEIISLFAGHGIDLADKTVLDVSGGPGSFAHIIKDKVKEVVVTEYDASSVEDMRLLLSGVRVFTADLNAPWPDKQVFDVVLYRSCVYFCHDFASHIADIAQMVAKGGYVFVCTNRPTLGNALRWQYEDYTHNVLYSSAVLRKSFEDSGFSVVDSWLSDFYQTYLDYYSANERFYHLFGIWNLLKPGAPRQLDARSNCVLARKTS